MQSIKKITVASRPSKLALYQANLVVAQLTEKFPKIKFEVVTYKTLGDKKLQQHISDIGGKGVFVKELEEALLNGKADIAVHSVKDMPCKMLAEFVMPTILMRAKTNDCLISRDNSALTELKSGAIIGTSSLRRSNQLKLIRPDLKYTDIRGNIDSRINKINGNYDAVVLAYAGLERSGLINKTSQIFTLDQVLPAAGQGAIGVQCLTNNQNIIDIIKAINDEESFSCISVEREIMQHLGGHCLAPIACHAKILHNRIHVAAKVMSCDSTAVLLETLSGEVVDGSKIAKQLATKLKQQGALEMIIAAKEKI